MTLALYMDHHVPVSIAAGLRRRGIDVLTAYEDGSHEWEDADLLDRATVLQRVPFTQDDDLLAEAARRQRNGTLFYGVIYGHQQRISVGRCVQDLELIVRICTADDVINDVLYLPI